MQAEEEKLSWKNKRLLESGIVCGIFSIFSKLFSADGNSVHDSRKGRIYHNILYHYRTACRPLFFKKYCGILTWIGVVIALAGLYFLCITQKLTIQRGDALILCCSVLYAGQILAIDHYNPFVDGVKMSCIQFLTGGILGAMCSCFYLKIRA